jgi:hypothetical protein
MSDPSHLTHLRASTVCYRDSLTFLHVYDAPTSQETRLYTSTACYGDNFTFYVNDVRTSQETYL